MEGTEKIIFTSNNGVREGIIFSRVRLFRGVGGDLCDLYLDMGPPGPGAKLVHLDLTIQGGWPQHREDSEFGSYFFTDRENTGIFVLTQGKIC